MTYLTPDSTDIDECIEMTLRALSAAQEMHYALSFPGFKPSTFGYDKGQTYSRVWVDNGTQRFVCFFVQRSNGDVWKAAGWKGPAKNFVRGNVMSREGRAALSLGKITESGYFYPAF